MPLATDDRSRSGSVEAGGEFAPEQTGCPDICIILFLHVRNGSLPYHRMEPKTVVSDPQQLRAEAEKEEPRRGLEPYQDVIRLLKEEKGFSFREIAAWLQQRGLDTDHNAVWRAYSKSIPGGSGGESYEQYERSEQRRSHEAAMPWLAGS